MDYWLQRKRDLTMKSLVQIVTGTWVFLIKIFIPGFEDFVGCKTQMYCFDRVKYKFHTRFRNPNVQVSIGSCGICIHGFNMWPWPIEPVVMAYCANGYSFDWICCLLGKIFTNQNFNLTKLGKKSWIPGRWVSLENGWSNFLTGHNRDTMDVNQCTS